jgi:hypothetical protein
MVLSDEVDPLDSARLKAITGKMIPREFNHQCHVESDLTPDMMFDFAVLKDAGK